MTIRRTALACLHLVMLGLAASAQAAPCAAPQQTVEATPPQVRSFFAGKRWKVLSFVGYSGAEYEDPAAMLKRAGRTLDALNPQRTVINIGATEPGVGAVYAVAKQRGFRTSGIVSTQAREQGVALSPCVDFVFYVKDDSWGGYLPGTTRLSPTSEAMVASSDVLVAIGGGEVARDELLAARRRGKRVAFVPAEMNHRLAREKAAGKGLPAPTDFRGAAHAALRPGR